MHRRRSGHCRHIRSFLTLLGRGAAPLKLVRFFAPRRYRRALRLHELITGYWLSQAIYVFAKLHIADLLRAGPHSAAQLAALSGADADALERLLRALSACAVVRMRSDRRFTLTPLGALLQSRAPLSLRDWALYNGAPFHWQPWSELLHCVRTGRTGTEKRFGCGFFDLLAQDRAAAALFDDAMGALSNSQNALLLRAFDFKRYRTVVDVGGGRGDLLFAILRAHRKTRGILYDLPPVAAAAQARAARAKLGGRWKTIGGSFFDAVPAGGDLYILKQVVHDWPDDAAVRILSNCRSAMRHGAALALVELVVPPAGKAPDALANMTDLEMLVCTGGRERSAREYAALLQRAGLRFVKLHKGVAPLALIEARAN